MPIHKLRFEVKLCKLKRLLLEHQLDNATGDHFIVSLLAVTRSIATREEDGIPPAAFDEVNRELQRIIDVVAGWAAPGAVSAQTVLPDPDFGHCCRRAQQVFPNVRRYCERVTRHALLSSAVGR